MSDMYYGIAACNEEKYINKCLKSLAEQDIQKEVKTIVCLNGCTDTTEKTVIESKKIYPRLNINIVHSKKGKVFAHNEIVRQISDSTKPVAFVDADVRVEKRAIDILYKELNMLDSLQAVGGHAVPYRQDDLSLWKSLVYETMHARALFPEAEVSVNDVSHYKSFVDTYPQPDLDTDFEKRSKIYFHGRMFMLRNKNVFDMPEDQNLADDSFLPNMIHTRYGPGSIRIRYDAIVYYEPYLSLRDHFRAYQRIYSQLCYLDDHFEEFSKSREMEKTKLDWRYIWSKGLSNVLRFAAYTMIIKTEHLGFRLLPYHSPKELWK